jgi:DNA repair protein RecO (recombination protein O)
VGLLSAEVQILDVVDLHDRDRIVTFLTREWGKKRGVAGGARTRHSRFGGQLQPLAKAQVTWFEKEGRDLVRISSVELVRTAHPLQGDLEGILLGSYLADHLLEFAQENEASDHLYRLLDSTLEALLAGVDRDLAARYFEAWMLRLAGIFPAPRTCPSCGAPFPPAGAVLQRGGEMLLCFDCGGRGGQIVAPETLEFLRRIGREGLPEAAAAPPAAAVLRQVEALCAQVRRHFLQRELRSYEVIRQTLAEL